jgi:dTDP-4-amino-4,6-dideoxygalactose transaminase
LKNQWKVGYVNYKLQSKKYGKDILKEIKRVMDAGDYILRDDVEKFERNIADFVGTKYAVGVNSCTDAMRLALKACNVFRGQEIITSSHTFLATLDAIVDADATPILVDSDFDHNINAKKVEENVTGATIALMPVHLNGRCCDMDYITSVANRCNLIIIEDAAQALGATFKGKRAGSFGQIGCFSFFPAKLLGTIGDAGVVVTNSEELYNKIRALRDYGRVKGEEQVRCYGQNSRLDNVHAAILNYKLQFVPEWIERRREIAALYHKNLCGVLGEKQLPVPPSDGDYYDIYQNYPIRVPYRDKCIEYLTSKGIEILVHWRTPLNKQHMLNLNHFKLPVTEAICDEVISLPMYQELKDVQVNYVCAKIEKFIKKVEKHEFGYE